MRHSLTVVFIYVNSQATPAPPTGGSRAPFKRHCFRLTWRKQKKKIRLFGILTFHKQQHIDASPSELDKCKYLAIQAPNILSICFSHWFDCIDDHWSPPSDARSNISMARNIKEPACYQNNNETTKSRGASEQGARRLHEWYTFTNATHQIRCARRWYIYTCWWFYKMWQTRRSHRF